MQELVWVEISKEALAHNIRQLRSLVGDKVILCPTVKANAYGHGIVDAARIFLESGANWLAVNAVYEAAILRKAGVEASIYVMGYVPLDNLAEAVKLDLRLVVYNRETVDRLEEEAAKLDQTVKIHLKAETGNNRQGLYKDDLIELAKHIKTLPHIEIEGLATHFANIEDTTDHSYADQQIAKFLEIDQALKESGITIKLRHSANSAATILFPKTHFELVRTGISNYGMWPSNETFVSFQKEVGRTDFLLKPAFTWKTKIAQIKTIPAGEYIGYGCTYKTTHDTKLAILPVGYYDGYDRGVSGKAHVLIHGKRAPVRGRVCMNITMVEVTDIPEAALEDEVVLIGQCGNEIISAEQFAAWADTINYEVTTRVNERIPRVFL